MFSQLHLQTPVCLFFMFLARNNAVKVVVLHVVCICTWCGTCGSSVRYLARKNCICERKMGKNTTTLPALLTQTASQEQSKMNFCKSAHL